MLNARCREILRKIVILNNNVGVDELSNKFNVSNRMIRYDIDSINEFLRSSNITEIEKKPNSPLKVVLDNKERALLINLLNNMNAAEYILSSNERIGIILYDLLSCYKVCTYSRLQEKFFVSKGTIVSDLRKVKLWLSTYNIKIIKYSNKGISIEGEEKSIRIALKELLIGNGEYNILDNLENVYKNENSNVLNKISKIDLSNENLDCIRGFIKELEMEFGVFTDIDFMNLVMTAFIIINRSYKEDEKESNRYRVLEEDYKKEYSAATNIINKLISKFKIDISKAEIGYLTYMILSSNSNNDNIDDSKDYFEACSITGTILENVEQAYVGGIYMDTHLYKSFLNHIKGLIFRLRFKVEVRNPSLDSINEIYKKEISLVKSACMFIEEKYKYKLSDDELGYITLYVCAAIEKNKSSVVGVHKNILVVCSAGFATGRLLENKIKSKFNIDKINIISVHGIKDYIKNEKVDLIVSTINIEEELDIPIIIISPILNEKDLNLLRQYLDYKPPSKKCEGINEIVNIISKNCNINNEENLLKDLEKYFKVESNLKKSIKDYITSSEIQLNIEAENWEEAIQLAAMPLLINGTIKQGYIDAMINSINKLGAYIVVDNGIAIPHAKGGGYVDKFGITITTFKQEITIGAYNNIKVFITVATPDEKIEMNIITEIMKLIENYEFMELLKGSDTVKEILEFIAPIKAF
ncbi:transcription antiterminator [Clostridium gasigenes]|uniref:BglG family transcription antiterminator n=1 Tax=Clostridium gasigenes TaxID=94869 RepID=UPI001626E98A|nr:BglG family transcription antiterminator [Clostridium gasigenes]MBB6625356.1 transcription antiterminator [Clostridium gasigenes]MBU3089992.1 BglG family transcription antiterminator [Clostridium gasigenes]